MKNYELIDVAGFCQDMHAELATKGTAIAFLSAILKGRDMSFEELLDFLSKLELKHSPSLERKLSSILKNPKKKIEPLGSEEMLLLLARLRNAAWKLPKLQGLSKISIECQSAPDAVIWATTVFWTMTSIDALMSIAHDYLRGGDSFSD